ncbi:MAG: hypothetical protein ACR2KK_15395 [Acidimicrobiales bacterium]
MLVLAGVAAVVRWGGLDFQPPDDSQQAEDPPSPGAVASRYLWYVAVAVVSGVGSGVLVAGAGGRLAMRLLAATAGDAAQGQVTEADQIVGEITADGSIGFIVFNGLFFGLATGALYLLIKRWLPTGRWGGLAYGMLLLIVAAPRIDPLRAENPDFGIVGPGWLAVVVFSAVVLVHGMLVAALAGRYSRTLPPPSRRRRTVLAYVPLLLLAPVAALTLILIVAGILAVGLSRVQPLMRRLRSPTTTVAGTVLLSLVTLVALPGFVSAILDIAAAS